MNHPSICDFLNTVPSATLGKLQTSRGEVILVYLKDADQPSELRVYRYDDLPRKCQGRIKWIAEDPLNVLGRKLAKAV